MNHYNVYLDILKRYRSVKSFESIEQDCHRTIVSLKGILMCRVKSLSNAHFELSAEEVKGVSAEKNFHLKHSPNLVSECMNYAALLLRLEVPASTLRKTVLNFCRGVFSQDRLEALGTYVSSNACETNCGNASSQKIPSVDCIMYDLDGVFVSSFVVFLKRYLFLFVGSVSKLSACVEAAESAESLPSHHLRRDQPKEYGCDATTHSTSNCRENIGEEDKGQEKDIIVAMKELLDVIDEVGGIYLLVAKRLFTSGSLKMQFPTMQEKDSFSESNLTKNSPHLLQPIADNLVATAKALNHFMKGASKTQDTLKPFISNLKYSTTINSTRPSFKDRAIEIVE